MTDAALLTLCRRALRDPGPSSDVTITFRRRDWDRLPEPAQRLISLHAGPLLPDAAGVLTMVVTAGAWREIEAAAVSCPDNR